MSFVDVTIPFAQAKIVWGWDVFNAIFDSCNLVTMCMIRGVCPAFRKAVDHAFSKHEATMGADMTDLAENIDKMVAELGLAATLELSVTVETLRKDPPNPKCCRKCAQRARLRKRLAIKFLTPLNK